MNEETERLRTSTETAITKPKRNTSGLRPPFKPGESGNPTGFSKRATVTEQVNVLLDQPIPEAWRKRFARQRGRKQLLIEPGTKIRDVAAMRLVALALDGDFRCLKELLDRSEGKVASRIQGSYVTAKVDATRARAAKEKIAKFLGVDLDEQGAVMELEANA